MSMGSDTAHDADTLQIHHDLREQHIHTAGIKAQIWAAREFDAAQQRKQCRCGPEGCADAQCPGRADHIGEATKMAADQSAHDLGMVQHLPTEDTEGGEL